MRKQDTSLQDGIAEFFVQETIVFFDALEGGGKVWKGYGTRVQPCQREHCDVKKDERLFLFGLKACWSPLAV
jgi:hypothetical protein